MNCIVVVDAWKSCEKEDLINFPWLEQETKLFGAFLNLQLLNIKKTHGYDIIHCASGLDIMDEIEIRDLIVDDIKKIPKYDFYYFCGFHLGRCINKKINLLNKQNTGVIINLSMLFPEDTYKNYFNKKIKNSYFYSLKGGFECTDIKT